MARASKCLEAALIWAEFGACGGLSDVIAYIAMSNILLYFNFSNLADAFIQSDLQIRKK